MPRLLAGKQPDIDVAPEGATEEERLAALIDAISSYVEHYHDGSVKMVAREEDTVKVELGGACVGCSITPATLCGWVLGTIQQFFPHIERIEVIEPPPSGEQAAEGEA
jgi:Fe-S cluster biogenesis protein NfuA